MVQGKGQRRRKKRRRKRRRRKKRRRQKKKRRRRRKVPGARAGDGGAGTLGPRGGATRPVAV